MTTLRQGDRGPAVLELQTLLAMTGHDPGPLDGMFGPRTLRAWIGGGFLTAHGIEPRGHDASPASELDDGDIAALRALPRRAVELPRILTPITATDMRIALVAGHASTFGDIAESMASAALAVRVALAQLAVEHGCAWWDPLIEGRLHEERVRPPEHLRPQRGAQAYVYVWNFNMGNRQVRAEDRMPGHLAILYGPMVPWFSMSPVEGSGTSAHRATSAHYAFASAAEGAAAYWRFLRDHCGPALAAFEAGDPAAAAHELKHGGWGYSGDEEAYTRGMVDRFRGIE